MENELILKEIISQNKHWNGDSAFFEEQKHRRNLFHELAKYLRDRQILSIVGLRRTGKTILLKQLISHLIEAECVDPKDILFLSFDEALLTSKLTLKRYLDTFLEGAFPDIGKAERRRYIVLDEIQYVEKWQHILKRYYDTEQGVKFIISGSSSLFLKKKTTESLAGRIYEFRLDPLSFDEFLELSDAEGKLLSEYRTYALPVGQSTILHDPKEYGMFLARYGSALSKLFEKYLLLYQFPEMVGQEDPAKIRKYLSESIYKKTIEYDIPRLFGVEKIDELKFLFQMLVNENGSIVEFKTISSEAGIEENTLKKYLSYFEESFLSSVVYNHSKSFRKSKRLQKKEYVASPNFFMAFRTDWNDNRILGAEYLGMLSETYVFNLLKRKYQYVSFYRKGREEFDFVASNDYRNTSEQALIEVKYVSEMKREDTRFIDRVAKKTFKTRYIVYSKGEFRADEDKLIVPCFLIR